MKVWNRIGMAALLFSASVGGAQATANGAAINRPTASTGNGANGPAAAALRLRSELMLTEAQVGKLEGMVDGQSQALARAKAAFLRAEADLVEAISSDDLSARKSALERRAKAAIDGEMAALRAARDVASVLTLQQSGMLAAEIAQLSAEGQRSPSSLWQPIVSPSPLVNISDGVADSAEVRVSVTPNNADIYIRGVRRGTGKKSMYLPVGRHELQLHAAGCQDIILPVVVVKGPPIIVPPQTLNCRP